ncbi:MAG: haloalkane dehalogenase [Thermoanaerobaculia bacterium]
MTADREISAAFPFESRYVEVLGSKMHYVDEGVGEPVLFLHGNPTSSYLWRNVIPHVTPVARAVVPDLIGMGRSDKPRISYRFFDHARYLDGFVEALALERPALVLHDWGSALGFHWARRHPDRVRGLAFMEAIVRPSSWREFPAAYKTVFRLFRAPLTGWLMIQVLNLFLDRILPDTVVRSLGAEEMAAYKAPYPTIASRRPLRQWPREIPIDGRPADVHDAVAAYSDWLQHTELPKLFVRVHPGAVLPRPVAEWVEASFPNLRSVDVGKGIHFIQEDHPQAIGRAVAEWLDGL